MGNGTGVPELILPTFLIIGAAKSGTTSLIDMLAQHPKLFRTTPKETKFFNDDTSFEKGIEWYSRTFYTNASKFPVRGEATPHYLYWGEKTTSRILQTPGLKNIKFIAIFRDPVKRAYSHYWMETQRGVEELSFEKALQEETKRLSDNHLELKKRGLLEYSYFQSGCYATLLQPYLENFPREQFFFLLQDDLKQNLPDLLERLCRFLDLEPGSEFHPVYSNSAFIPINRKLHHFYQFPSGPIYQLIHQVLRLFPVSYRYRLRQWIVRANLQVTNYPPMTNEVEQKLRLQYKDEVIKLERILERDLHHWLK